MLHMVSEFLTALITHYILLVWYKSLSIVWLAQTFLEFVTHSFPGARCFQQFGTVQRFLFPSVSFLRLFHVLGLSGDPI